MPKSHSTIYKLPKDYLSYSAITLWSKDKAKFRRRYYENIKDKDTVYTLFGKEVHAQIEKDPKFAHIRLPIAEQRMSVHIEGVPILGYIDTFDDVTCDFGEYKTAILNSDGSSKWTQLTVQKHDQLPFYSLLIQEKFGKKINKTFLVWLETVFKDNVRSIGGVKLGGERELVLTGKHEIFHRKMFQYDRDRIREWIIQSAKEISDDYQEWLIKNNGKQIV